MKNYIWKSDFAQLITSFLEYKRLEGYKFEIQERRLQHFDHFHYHSGFQGTHLTKVLLDEFIYAEDEKPSTHYNKEVIMNSFATYVASRGCLAYIPQIKTKLPRSKYVPHIYTKDEVGRFLRATDNYPLTSNSYRNTVDPVLFRFLYCTGVRLSEALNLRIGDINLPDGYVTILNSKNNNSRLVPVTQTMTERLESYIRVFHTTSNNDAFVFPGKNRNRMDQSTAYNHFRDYLLMADIPHTGVGPRIHDFRHGVAVENLRRWSVSGKDLSNLLPYLSAFMGHVDFRATQYYLRLTAEIYPDLVALVEKHCGDIIPELEGFYYEEG